MRIATISCALPIIGAGAGGNWLPLLLSEMIADGHEVFHLLGRGKYAVKEVESNENHRLYTELGATVIPVDLIQDVPQPTALKSTPLSFLKRMAGIYSHDPALIWPREIATSKRIADVLRRLNVDFVVPLAMDGMLLTWDWQDTPKIAIDAEGPHINTLIKWRYIPEVPPGPSLAFAKYSYQTWTNYIRMKNAYLEVLARQDRIFLQGPHYADWATKNGLKNAIYCATPVPDFAGDSWQQDRRQLQENNQIPQITVVGHLDSTSSQTSLPLLFDEVLPGLLERLGPDSFHLNIIGRNERLPARYDHWRTHPAVKFHGAITPLTPSLLSADIILVTVPGPTGRRMRLVHALSHGCCVVAHQNNHLGLPELTHGNDVLFGKNGKEIIQMVINALNDSKLRIRIGNAAHETFHKHYSSKVRMPVILSNFHHAMTASAKNK
tara:strand:- start:17083 stop:18393 length:1311 start_codon:yes stop_codon:yes gene_type:complete